MLHSFKEGGRTRLYSPTGLVQLANARYNESAPVSEAVSPALMRLCAAFEEARPGQTMFGKLHAQAILVDVIGKRLRLARLPCLQPDGAGELPPPLFIVAPFRTGTTFLHRLLACDPQARWPRLWEVAYPPPADDRLCAEAAYFTLDPRRAEAAAALRLLHRASPVLGRLHPMAPDLPEECFGLLETSGLSHSFLFYAELPSYLDWLDERDEADWRAAYRLYAAQLQRLHLWHPGRRWVLKSPVHLWNLDALLHAFPQAHIVQLHRDPAHSVASFCQLLAAYRQAMCKARSPASVGDQVACYTAKVLTRAVAARKRLDARRFIDVGFEALIDDPLAVVRAIYARTGDALTAEAAGAMRRWLSGLRHDPAPRQSLDSFGLDGGRLREMFGAYTAGADRSADA